MSALRPLSRPNIGLSEVHSDEVDINLEGLVLTARIAQVDLQGKISTELQTSCIDVYLLPLDGRAVIPFWLVVDDC